MVFNLKNQQKQGIGNNQIELITLEMNLVELEVGSEEYLDHPQV